MSDSNTVVTGNSAIDVDKIRKDFPILSTTVRGKPLIYLDNGATTHKPQRVIERVRELMPENMVPFVEGPINFANTPRNSMKGSEKK